MTNEVFDIAAQVYKSLLQHFSQERIFSVYQSEKDKIIYKSHTFAYKNMDSNPEDECFLTDGLAYLFYVNRLISGDDKRFLILNKPLNSNYNSLKVAIYGNTSATTKVSSTNFSLNSIFGNLRFYDLAKYEKNNLEISVNVIDCNDVNNKEINIYFVPYPNTFMPTRINDVNKTSFAERTEIDELDKTYLKRLENVIDIIDISRTSIIFSPEMVGSNKLNEQIEELISSKIPSLVVCPSFHRIEESKILNQSLIFYKNNFSYESVILNKVFPAKLKIKKDLEVNENLSVLETYKIHIFHITNIGTIMVVICIDFDKQCIDDLIDDVLPDLVLVESYTPNYKFFAEKAFYFASHNIFCLLGNACCMCKEDKHYLIGFAPCVKKTTVMPAEPIYFGSIDNKICSDCIHNYFCHKKITFSAKYDEKFKKIILKFKEESNE